MRTAPARSIRRHACRTGVTVTLCLALVPAVPAGPVVGATGTPGNGAANSSPGAGGVAGAPAAAQPAAPGVARARVRSVALHGVDKAVLAIAPRPGASEHAHGAVGRSDLDGPARPAPESLLPAVALTVPAGTRPASLVAVSADTPFAAGTSIQVRVKQADGWSDWQSLAADDGHGPDPGSVEARGARVGSEPLMTADATKAQVRIDTPDGRVPAGTALDVVSAPTSAADRALAGSAAGDVAAAAAAPAGTGAPDSSPPQVSAQATTRAAAAIPRPAIFTRAQWGADESWRSRAPYYTGAIKAGFLHHTASTSNYSPEQTPAQIRAIYAYHTKSLGHSDIDYNFVVDRFGRLWEGRYGGMDRAVLGGHTAGFNENTFAVVALGNFQSTAPSPDSVRRIKDSVARLFAWKLGRYGVSPVSTARLVSAGFVRPTRYPKGTVAAIPAISSHQMVNYTSCPGAFLQRELPAIRALAARYAHVVIAPPTPAVSTVQTGTAEAVSLVANADRAVRWRADILSPCSTTPVRSFSGRISKPGRIALRWDLRDEAGTQQLPAAYSVRVTGRADDGSPVLPVGATVVITPAPGGSWGPCRNVARVTGTDDAATSVLWGGIFAPGSKTAVLTAPATEGESALAAGVVAGPLASHVKAPLLLSPKAGLSPAVAADLRARGTSRVLVVGGTSVVPSAVVRAVERLGIAVTRLAGDTAAETAAVVAARFPATRPAVLVAPGSAPAHSLAGAALAATRDQPVLLTGSTTIPAATRAALATRPAVTVAVPTTLADRTIEGALPPASSWARLWGVDEVAASTTISAAASQGLQRVVVLPANPSAWATAPLAAAAASPLLFTGATTLPAAVGSLLDSRAALRAGLTPVARAALSDSVLGAASRLLAGAAWAPAVRASYRLSRANATPEPVRAGAVLTVRARVRVSDGTGGWRAAPRGTVVTLQHRVAGASSYRAVTSVALTEAGRVRVTARATTTGRWRLAVAGSVSKSDRVQVRS